MLFISILLSVWFVCWLYFAVRNLKANEISMMAITDFVTTFFEDDNDEEDSKEEESEE